MSLRKKMPSINALVTFEAAFRKQSFTHAARELGVSQAAVSRQVNILEKDLGIPLFVRAHRRVVPTQAGKQLGTTLISAFSSIADVTDNLRHTGRSNIRTVGATLAFTQFWLLPRLQQFREEHPDQVLRIISQDTRFDLQQDDVDLVIQFGLNPRQDGRVFSMAKDTVFPVCSPQFLSRQKQPVSLRDLLRLPLIASDSPYEGWLSWSEWFSASGIKGGKPNVALHFNNYSDSVSAALAGEGIVLGWQVILENLLHSGQLVPFTSLAIYPPQTYNLVVPEHKLHDEDVIAIIRWFFRQFNYDYEGEDL